VFYTSSDIHGDAVLSGIAPARAMLPLLGGQVVAIVTQGHHQLQLRKLAGNHAQQFSALIYKRVDSRLSRI